MNLRKALVVGINNYPDAPLRGAVNDATDIAKLLKRHEDQSVNFGVYEKMDILQKSELMRHITQLFSGIGEIALFYFAGHGFVNELGGYLVTPDHKRYDEGISMKDIIILANNSKISNKIIILDCCHGGSMTAPSLAHNEIGHINEGVTILTASRHDQTAMEVRGRGVFTNLLVEALKGGAADIGGNITPGSVYAYIDQALNAWEQRPVFKTNVSSFISLRNVLPRIPIATLRQITAYFKDPLALHELNPSYEYTNDPMVVHDYVLPFAHEDNVAIFKTLQKMESVGLVEPVEEEHMYWAAMKGKSCRLTPLGAHYWRLLNDGKI